MPWMSGATRSPRRKGKSVLSRVLCWLGLHRWRRVACTNAATTGEPVTVYRQCERCHRRGYIQDPRYYEPVDYDWLNGQKDVPLLRANWERREGK